MVLFLFFGGVVAQASGLFAEGEKPAQRTDAGKTSEDLAVRSVPGFRGVFHVDEDGDIELKQEQPDHPGEKPLKEKAQDASVKKGETGKAERNAPAERKADVRPSGKKEKIRLRLR